MNVAQTQTPSILNPYTGMFIFTSFLINPIVPQWIVVNIHTPLSCGYLVSTHPLQNPTLTLGLTSSLFPFRAQVTQPLW